MNKTSINTVKMKITLENYVVCFVDIMGQKSKLDKLNMLCLKDNNIEVKTIIDQTYGVINNFRTHMRDATDWVEKHSTIGIPEIDSNNILICSFSDFIASYVSLRNDAYKVPLKGIYFLMFTNALVFLQMLSEKNALRGGIDLGIGVETNQNNCRELYGSAISNPYRLESKIADYPRIVVGLKLYDFINTIIKENKFSGESDDNVHFANECLKIIKKDTDGQWILDYLSAEFQGFSKFNDFYKKAKYFIDEQIISCNQLKANNEKMKYIAIKAYFDQIIFKAK